MTQSIFSLPCLILRACLFSSPSRPLLPGPTASGTVIVTACGRHDTATTQPLAARGRFVSIAQVPASRLWRCCEPTSTGKDKLTRVCVRKRTDPVSFPQRQAPFLMTADSITKAETQSLLLRLEVLPESCVHTEGVSELQRSLHHT